MSDSEITTVAAMGTVVTIELLHESDATRTTAVPSGKLERAIGWFHAIEQRCSRFDPGSELAQLSQQIGVPVAVSPLLFEALRFAVMVAEESGGAFDPAVGAQMEELGFTQEFRSGTTRRSPTPASTANYRTITLDAAHGTVTLQQPIVLDLGAVVKGMAVDLAANELLRCPGFAIDAGGDVRVHGHNRTDEPWRIGVRHPHHEGEVIETLLLHEASACTSGDYARRSPTTAAHHHLIDARSGEQATGLASVTVVAPLAMVADALATAAFVLGPVEGVALLERQGVEGLFFSNSLERFTTKGWGAAP